MTTDPAGEKDRKLALEEVQGLRHRLFFEIGLYERLPISIVNFNVIVGPHDRFDAYCTSCKRSSTMRSDPDSHNVFRSVLRPAGGSNRSLEVFDWITVQLHCTRNETHILKYYFLNDRDWIMKIGQHPSMADIAINNLGRIERVLTQEDRAELVRAIGLHAHGIGVGSFAYLRRILERLVTQAEKGADITTDGKRFVERVKALHGKLPSFLCENAHLHGILSKGIHELSEDECLGAFPVVRAAIEEVFEEQLAEVRRREASEHTAKALNKLNSELAQVDDPES